MYGPSFAISNPYFCFGKGYYKLINRGNIFDYPPFWPNFSAISVIATSLRSLFLNSEELTSYRQLYSGHNSTSFSSSITLLRRLPDAILNWSFEVTWLCNAFLLHGWLIKLSQCVRQSHDCRTHWGICLARPKISNMFDFILTASRGEFLTKTLPHTWGNGWASCLARNFAQLFPHVCGRLYKRESQLPHYYQCQRAENLVNLSVLQANPHVYEMCICKWTVWHLQKRC